MKNPALSNMCKLTPFPPFIPPPHLSSSSQRPLAHSFFTLLLNFLFLIFFVSQRTSRSEMGREEGEGKKPWCCCWWTCWFRLTTCVWVIIGGYKSSTKAGRKTSCPYPSSSCSSSVFHPHLCYNADWIMLLPWLSWWVAQILTFLFCPCWL